MRRLWPHILLVVFFVLVLVVFSGCSLTGPTCTSYLKMTETQQRKAALDWLVFNDLVEDRTSMQVDRQVTGTQQFLVVQCKIQQQQDIPTMLNQFRP